MRKFDQCFLESSQQRRMTSVYSCMYSAQVISPAFRIDDHAGIRSVGSDIQENSSVEYYNFQGIRISKPEPGMPVIERRGDSVVKTIAR